MARSGMRIKANSDFESQKPFILPKCSRGQPMLHINCRFGRPLAACCAMAILTSCSGDDPDTAAADAASTDIYLPETAIFDGVADAQAGSDISTAEQDSSAADCPGGPGCNCSANSDCDAGLCIESPTGRVCADKCIDHCNDGFQCAQVPVGADVILVCVSSWARLCSPCAETKDCNHPGVTDARCIDRGDSGAFCGSACVSDLGCPTGYGCKDAKDVDGNTVKQCLPVGSDAQLRACDCSANAVVLGLKSSCVKKVVTGEKELSCAGEAQCKKADDTAICAANDPSAEACDGVDNDCDGETDEGACDDSAPCTMDSCEVTKKACSHAPVKEGSACDADGSVCTESDVCKSGKCTAGTAKNCDDKNPCTKDSCDAANGCSQAADDGVPCDDENPCTIGDVCKGKSCAAGAPKKCTSSKPCVSAECDPSNAGKCKFSDKKKGATCDDGDACTKDDGCDGGACAGAKVTCDDKNPCTDDSCVVDKGCLHSANTATCEDGDKCTLVDTCKDKLCVAGKPKPCDDKQPCTVDSCDTTTGECAFNGLPKDATPCNADGSVCTVGDACKAGKCVAGAEKKCDDGNACTIDSCHSKSGCAHVASTAPCDADGNACTVADTCKDKACVSGKPKTCDDSEFCTADSCDKATGKCVFAALPMEATPCDADSSVCTLGDACNAGKCIAGAAKKCDDGNVCTQDSCDAKTGCRHTANTATCSDGQKCTLADACKDKACVAGKPKQCDDTKACTVDTCNPKSGECKFDGAPQEAKPCDADGSVCTVSDFCKAGNCVAGSKKKCDDGNVCTNNGCDAKSGCTTTNNTAACNDHDPCTEKDICGAGKCAGAKRTCNDGNACTDDACTNAQGCVHRESGSPCDDKDACTEKDVCGVAGTIKAYSGAVPAGFGVCKGSAVKCDDGNPCTTDSCDKGKGCQKAVAKDTTSCSADGKKWCKAGKCVPKASCGDGVVNQATEGCDDGNSDKNDGCDACVCKPLAVPWSTLSVTGGDTHLLADTKKNSVMGAARSRLVDGETGPISGTESGNKAYNVCFFSDWFGKRRLVIDVKPMTTVSSVRYFSSNNSTKFGVQPPTGFNVTLQPSGLVVASGKTLLPGWNEIPVAQKVGTSQVVIELKKQSEHTCVSEIEVVTQPCCGDGVVNAGEMCDDGNKEDGDACLSNCTAPCNAGSMKLTAGGIPMLAKWAGKFAQSYTDFTAEMWLRGKGSNSQGYVLCSHESQHSCSLWAASQMKIGGNSYQDGKWHHLAVVFDSATKKRRYFIDGKSAGGEYLSSWPAELRKMGLGIGGGGKADNYWNGEIAGLRLSRAALYEKDFLPPRVYGPKASSVLMLPMVAQQPAALKDAGPYGVPVDVAASVKSGAPGPYCFPTAACGNGILEANEECDDGNKSNGDGCSVTCKVGSCTKLTAAGPSGAGVHLKPGADHKVSWKGTGKGLVNLYINRSHPTGEWEPIVKATPNDGEYVWRVTGPKSGHAAFVVECAGDKANKTGSATSFFVD